MRQARLDAFFRVKRHTDADRESDHDNSIYSTSLTETELLTCGYQKRSRTEKPTDSRACAEEAAPQPLASLQVLDSPFFAQTNALLHRTAFRKCRKQFVCNFASAMTSSAENQLSQWVTEDSLVSFSSDDMTPSTTRDTAVVDITVDHGEEFAMVSSRASLSLLSLTQWKQCAEKVVAENRQPLPLVKLGASIIRNAAHVGHSLSFGFSSAQFVGDSLSLVCAYQRGAMVDVFDLEDVDEETCLPVHRFALADVKRVGVSGSERGATETAATGSYANDVVSVTPHTTLAALSSGETVLLDVREKRGHVCTGLEQRRYCVGSQADPNRDYGSSPLTSVAVLPPCYVLTGSKSGVVRLWDARYTRDALSLCRGSSEVGSIVPSYGTARGRTGSRTAWFNTYGGDVIGLAVGPSGMLETAKAFTADAARTELTQHLPTAKLSVIDPEGVLLCPHFSSNSVLAYDIGRFDEEEAHGVGEVSRRSDEMSAGCDSENTNDESFFDLHNESQTSGLAPNSTDGDCRFPRFRSAHALLLGTSTYGAVSQSSFSENRAESQLKRTPCLPLISTLPMMRYGRCVSSCVAIGRSGLVGVGDVSGAVCLLDSRFTKVE